MLDDGEMVEADRGYIGEGKFIRCPDDALDRFEFNEKNDVRARHETCNRRFKQWNILKQQFRNSKNQHGIVFHAVATLTQLDIEHGNVLFGCEPITKKQASYFVCDL